MRLRHRARSPGAPTGLWHDAEHCSPAKCDDRLPGHGTLVAHSEGGVGHVVRRYCVCACGVGAGISAPHASRARFQIRQAHRPIPLRQSQQLPKHLRCRDRIASSAVAPFNLDPEVIAHRIEIGGVADPAEFPRQPHRTDARPCSRSPVPLDLRRHEHPVEPRVVRDEDPGPLTIAERIRDFISNVGASRTIFASIPVSPATNCGIGIPGLTSEWKARRAIEQ